jgi:magnesium chelatase family protein
MSYIPFGYEGILVRIEADIRRGIPGIDISGLAEGAVREAKERIRAAFRNSGYKFPSDRVLINLAPAGVKKFGAALDLPIALAVMSAAGIIAPLNDTLVLGELELSGNLRPVRGVLAATACAMEDGIKDFIVPLENKAEAEILARGSVAGVLNLDEAVKAVSDDAWRSPCECKTASNLSFYGDFSEVRGQARYKRALEIAAAGAHNLLVFGPPGAGKTMLARRLPSIMAPLDRWDAVTVTRLHSLAGVLNGASLITEPPFRSPHHSASAAGILGGGKSVQPGEISLAHNGVLFLDEAPEFQASVLQSLREPLEDKIITISRAEGRIKLPSDFQLIMAANPCPCGKLGTKGDCMCSGDEIHRYWRKFGGALLDRIEIRVAVNVPPISAMVDNNEEKSSVVAARVEKAVQIQRARYKGLGIRCNSSLSAGQIEQFCCLSDGAQNAFSKAVDKLSLSGRAYHSALRVARTIADLEGKEAIGTEHILEAVQHRRQGDDPYDVFNTA